MVQNTRSRSKNKILTVRETVIFALLGAMMYVSDLMMEALPNIHLLGVFIVSTTVVYRWKALWGMTMLLPKNMPKWLAPIVYCAVCALHGLSFGTIFAPAQALMVGFTFKQMLAWIAAGFYFDITHAIGNLCLGVLIVPMIHTLRLAGKAAKKE